MLASAARRVGIIGYGTIGAPVAAGLQRGAVPGATLECVVSRDPIANLAVDQVNLEDAARRCDVIVECAGQHAVALFGENVLRAGVDLLITSVGALADEPLAKRLHATGPGRLFLTAGAVGGLDLLAAARYDVPFHRVVVTTTKLPGSLVQPWMSAEQAGAIRSTSAPVEVYSGNAREAARLFPRSLNVVAAVAFVVQDWHLVTVKLVADPHAALTSHLIEASSPTGEYRFEIRNLPSPQNPRTSRIVPFAVLKSLATVVGPFGGMI